MASSNICELVASHRTDRDTIDELTDSALRGWRKVIDPMRESVEKLADECSNAEEFKTKLAAMRPDRKTLVDEMARLCFQACGLGDARDEP